MADLKDCGPTCHLATLPAQLWWDCKIRSVLNCAWRGGRGINVGPGPTGRSTSFDHGMGGRNIFLGGWPCDYCWVVSTEQYCRNCVYPLNVTVLPLLKARKRSHKWPSWNNCAICISVFYEIATWAEHTHERKIMMRACGQQVWQIIKYWTWLTGFFHKTYGGCTLIHFTKRFGENWVCRWRWWYFVYVEASGGREESPWRDASPPWRLMQSTSHSDRFCLEGAIISVFLSFHVIHVLYSSDCSSGWLHPCSLSILIISNVFVNLINFYRLKQIQLHYVCHKSLCSRVCGLHVSMLHSILEHCVQMCPWMGGNRAWKDPRQQPAVEAKPTGHLTQKTFFPLPRHTWCPIGLSFRDK